jgi:hypothetical protein
MDIARHPVLSHPAYASCLPPDLEVLYELSKIEPAKLEAGINDGSVFPDMERTDVLRLRHV